MIPAATDIRARQEITTPSRKIFLWVSSTALVLTASAILACVTIVGLLLYFIFTDAGAPTLTFRDKEQYPTNKAEIVDISPDKNWAVVAQWTTGMGYYWQLRNQKTGQLYFGNDGVADHNGFPARLEALWSPDGRHVAVTTYWDGPSLELISVVGEQPARIHNADESEDIREHPDIIVRGEDRPTFNGFYQLTVKAERWLNNTDVVVKTFMSGKVDDEDVVLRTTVHRTLRCDDRSYRVLSQTCDLYDKTLYLFW